jgi:hypothetical protein
MAVAMRRMTRPQALQEYARRRWPVLVQGGLLAFGSTVPFVALLVPVVGVAALTHVLNQGRLNQGRLDRGPLNRTMPAGATMLGHGPASSPTDRKNGGVSLVQAP